MRIYKFVEVNKLTPSSNIMSTHPLTRDGLGTGCCKMCCVVQSMTSVWGVIREHGQHFRTECDANLFARNGSEIGGRNHWFPTDSVTKLLGVSFENRHPSQTQSKACLLRTRSSHGLSQDRSGTK